jgi:hypothetical protein
LTSRGMGPGFRRDDNVAVIAGLDPAIHHLRKILFQMDARVKPAHDDWRS